MIISEKGRGRKENRVADLSQNMKEMLKDKIRKIGLDKISKSLNL